MGTMVISPGLGKHCLPSIPGLDGPGLWPQLNLREINSLDLHSGEIRQNQTGVKLWGLPRVRVQHDKLWTNPGDI